MYIVQGFHDIVVTFLLVVGEDLTFAIMNKLCLNHLRYCIPSTEKNLLFIVLVVVVVVVVLVVVVVVVVVIVVGASVVAVIVVIIMVLISVVMMCS